MMLTRKQKEITAKNDWHVYVLIIVIVFSFLGCDILDDKDDECDSTVAQWIELILFPDVKITHANGEAFDGFVKFNVYKEYCDGTVSGNFSKEAETDPDGFANFSYRYTYELKNRKDIIYFSYVINQGGKTYEKKGEITYDMITQEEPTIYADVPQFYLEMHADFFEEEAIVLTWNKD